MEKIWNEDSDYFLFPTWTPCKMIGCVYFFLNKKNKGEKLMRAELKKDDTVEINIIDNAENTIR